MPKSAKKKQEEGWGTGIGKDYKPYHHANEKGSFGTSALIYDPFEERMISVMSNTERNFYYHIRWDDRVEHIREQYPMDHDLVNEVRSGMGLRRIPKGIVYTTDFFIDYEDGSQHAYSIKWKRDLFNPNCIEYEGHPEKYNRLIERMKIEIEYWKLQDIPYSIVTQEDFDRKEAENIAFVMKFYNERYIVTEEQKLLYLIAHKAIWVPMDQGRLNPHKILEQFPYNINDAYENFRKENNI